MQCTPDAAFSPTLHAHWPTCSTPLKRVRPSYTHALRGMPQVYVPRLLFAGKLLLWPPSAESPTSWAARPLKLDAKATRGSEPKTEGV